MLTLHVGLPKTGTTFLQRQVFAGCEDPLFLHRRQGTEAEALCRDLRRYVKCAGLVAPFLRRRVRSRLAAIADAAGIARLLVSDENIAIGSVGFWTGKGPDPVRVAGRIAEILPGEPVRVLIGIRRQDQWLASRYAESSRGLDGLGQDDFDRRMREIGRTVDLKGPLAWLDYGSMHQRFADALGPENVKLVSLERIVASPAATIRALEAFIGAGPAEGSRNLKPSGTGRNRLSKGPNTWRMRKGGGVLHLAPEVQATLLERFAVSNDALARVVPDAFGA
jgi:hypothetical protein